MPPGTKAVIRTSSAPWLCSLTIFATNALALHDTHYQLAIGGDLVEIRPTSSKSEAQSSEDWKMLGETDMRSSARGFYGGPSRLCSGEERRPHYQSAVSFKNN